VTIDHLLEGATTHPLPASEQTRLVAEYRRTADPAMESRLVEANLRLVVKLAREMDRSQGRYLDDLVQEGCLGLLQGIRRFNPKKGARLSTYAAFWIRAYIMKYLMDNVCVVRAVRTRAERAAFFKGVVGAKEVSFETPIAPNARPIGDVLRDPAAPADSLLEVAQLAYQAKQSAARLEQRLAARELTILRERVLAPDPPALPLIAKRVSLSSERVRQIEGRLKTALRSSMDAGSFDIAA
jgi:RNA polymerase sigma-32 factor